MLKRGDFTGGNGGKGPSRVSSKNILESFRNL
jgi:hypothetical protein